MVDPSHNSLIQHRALFWLPIIVTYLIPWIDASAQPQVPANSIITEYRWSAWTEYSTCTRSCGIGIKVRQRACFRFGETPELVEVAYCGGISREAKTCNIQQCPTGARDFRSLQCSFFNGKKHGGAEHNAWVPYRPAKFFRRRKIKACALACVPYGRGHFVVQFSSQVVDGTECRENPHSVCVAGQCVAVGCDNELHSRTREDWCGVCGGDNSTCETLSGHIAKNITVGYSDLLTIPRGARHVKIVDRDSRDVVLAVRDTQGSFFINGHLETRYSTITRLVAGTIFYYHHPLYDGRGMETFQAEGPVNQDLFVVGHTVRGSSSVEILYEYTILKNTTTQLPPRHFPLLREKSLPWEAILYEKLHPGYNIGAVGSAYVKRKKEGDGASFKFRIPPWKPPEPSLVPTKYETSATSTGKTTRDLRESLFHPTKSPPFYNSTSGFTTSHFSSTSLPRRQIDKFHQRHSITRQKSRNGTAWEGEPQEIPGSRDTFEDALERPRPRLRYKVREKIKEKLATRLPTSNESLAAETSEESKTLATTTDGILDSDYPESFANLTLLKHPVTDEIPVFIPAEEENEDQGFRMTEDLIGSNVQHGTSENITGYEEFHTMVSGHDALHPERELPASFSEGGYPGRTEDYEPSYPAQKSRPDPRYQWVPKSITPCSSTCAPGGVQFEFFECRRVADGLTVLDSYCDEGSKPDPRYHQCTRQHCVARWVTGIWSHCSRSCGDGQAFRSVRCWRMLAPGFDSTVHADQCKSYQKPEPTRKCNEGACGPQWQFSAWGKCSAQCGRGEQSRTVRCNTGNGRDCQKSPRPTDRRSCGSSSCENYWKTTKWTRCSGPCGSGIKQRQVMCRGPRGRALDETSCDRNIKPLSVHGCGDNDYCQFVWVPQRWEKCSAMCGEGNAERKVVCGAVSSGRFQVHPGSYCNRLTKPISKARCRELSCQPKWLTTEWSKCSKSCGKGGIKMREVRCYLDDEESDRCDQNLKPTSVEECPLPLCDENRRDEPHHCTDDKKRINCQLVLKVQLCQHWYYKTACCKSCSKVKTGRAGTTSARG